MKTPSPSNSDLQFLLFFLPPHSEPNFHNFQLVRSKREGKAEDQGQGEDTGRPGPLAEAENVV